MFDFNPFPTGAGQCAENGIATLSCIPNILVVVITLAIVFAFIICLILIVYSGIKFMTSGGDEKQVEGARKTLTFSIIGLVVVLASFFIVQLIGNQTGVTCIKTFGFSSCLGSSSPPSGFPCSGPKPAGCPVKAVCDSSNTWKCVGGR